MISSKPSCYIKGWVEFYKLRFKVTPDVLIPRPETELLVDFVIEFCRQQTINHEPITILDLGTGSGNIIISLAKNLSHIGGVTFIASDISEKALEIAKQNAKLHKVEDKITFLRSNLLDSFYYDKQSLKSSLRSNYRPSYHSKRCPDIIVTNLPYIPSARIPYLDPSVKDFEPHVALDGGQDGFELYRKLFQQIASFSLPPQGWKPKLIIGEIDYTHGELAATEAGKYFPDAQIEVTKDLAHLQRILTVKFPIG